MLTYDLFCYHTRQKAQNLARRRRLTWHFHHYATISALLDHLPFQCLVLFGLDATGSRDGCRAVAILLHYFLLAAFGWMAAEGINTYYTLNRVITPISHKCINLAREFYSLVDRV